MADDRIQWRNLLTTATYLQTMGFFSLRLTKSFSRLLFRGAGEEWRKKSVGSIV